MANTPTVPAGAKNVIDSSPDALLQSYKKENNSASIKIDPFVSGARRTFTVTTITDRYECVKNEACLDVLSDRLTTDLIDAVNKTSLPFATYNIPRDEVKQAIKNDLKSKADKEQYQAPNTPSPNVGEPANSDSGVGLKDTPTASTPAQPESATSVVSADNRKAYAEYRSTERNIPPQRFNSWILSWEPTQKVGIVKVPVSKIIKSLGAGGLNESDNANPYQDVTTFFRIADLIDFEQVTKRIFLPLSSNKLILLKDFSIQRKNIQSAEVTYGSRYFQVFAESFPDFSMQIEVVIFHDTAKKVKLFFDNVMKRISETSRYSGSLYIHDVLAEEIPAFDAIRLSNLVDTKELVKYRLLPRTIRTNRSSEDPNMMKITIEGIVVEWEKQDESIIRLTSSSTDKPAAGAAGATTQSGTQQTPEADKPLVELLTKDQATGRLSSLQVAPELASGLLIGPSGKYANTFSTQNLSATVNVAAGNTLGSIQTVNRVIRRIGNTLYKDAPDEVKALYAGAGGNADNTLWSIDYLESRPTNIVGAELELSDQGKKELIADTENLYQQIATKLSNAYKEKQDAGWYSNVYNSVLGRAIADLQLPGNQQAAFEKGMRKYLQQLASSNAKQVSLAQKLFAYKVLTEAQYLRIVADKVDRNR